MIGNDPNPISRFQICRLAKHPHSRVLFGQAFDHKIVVYREMSR